MDKQTDLIVSVIELMQTMAKNQRSQLELLIGVHERVTALEEQLGISPPRKQVKRAN